MKRHTSYTNKQGNVVTSLGKGRWSEVCEKCCEHLFSNPGRTCHCQLLPGQPTRPHARHPERCWQVAHRFRFLHTNADRWVTATRRQEENPRRFKLCKCCLCTRLGTRPLQQQLHRRPRCQVAGCWRGWASRFPLPPARPEGCGCSLLTPLLTFPKADKSYRHRANTK